MDPTSLESPPPSSGKELKKSPKIPKLSLLALGLMTFYCASTSTVHDRFNQFLATITPSPTPTHEPSPTPSPSATLEPSPTSTARPTSTATEIPTLPPLIDLKATVESAVAATDIARTNESISQELKELPPKALESSVQITYLFHGNAMGCSATVAQVSPDFNHSGNDLVVLYTANHCLDIMNVYIPAEQQRALALQINQPQYKDDYPLFVNFPNIAVSNFDNLYDFGAVAFFYNGHFPIPSVGTENISPRIPMPDQSLFSLSFPDAAHQYNSVHPARFTGITDPTDSKKIIYNSDQHFIPLQTVVSPGSSGGGIFDSDGNIHAVWSTIQSNPPHVSYLAVPIPFDHQLIANQAINRLLDQVNTYQP